MLSDPGPLQIERARFLLAHEGADGTPAACGEAAARVYEKIHTQLTPLLGAAGVKALLVRSAKLSQSRFSFLGASAVESSTTLRECLQAQDAAVADEVAVALFGRLLTLLMMFIGERLTTQALSRDWPTIEQMPPSAETKT